MERSLSSLQIDPSTTTINPLHYHLFLILLFVEIASQYELSHYSLVFGRRWRGQKIFEPRISHRQTMGVAHVRQTLKEPSFLL